MLQGLPLWGRGILAVQGIPSCARTVPVHDYEDSPCDPRIVPNMHRMEGASWQRKEILALIGTILVQGRKDSPCDARIVPAVYGIKGPSWQCKEILAP